MQRTCYTIVKTGGIDRYIPIYLSIYEASQNDTMERERKSTSSWCRLHAISNINRDTVLVNFDQSINQLQFDNNNDRKSLALSFFSLQNQTPTISININETHHTYKDYMRKNQLPVEILNSFLVSMWVRTAYVFVNCRRMLNYAQKIYNWK